MSRDNGNGEVTFDILEHIGVLATFTTGWKKEINLVSWNNAPGKYDIREWDPSHERMSKGITLKENEMRTLLEVMRRRHRGELRGSAPDELRGETASEDAVNDGDGMACDAALMESFEESAREMTV